MEKIHASKLLAGLVPAGFLTSDPEVELVTTDSREVRPGCIFVAFPGERFDGHDFAAQAVAAGAAAVLCTHDVPGLPAGCAVLLAGDLFDSARVYRDTLEALRAALAACRCPVFIAPGNHDALLPGSPYLENGWPENVHIFRTAEPERVSLPEFDVYGAGFLRAEMPAMLDGFRVADPARLNILVLHGDAENPASPYDPVSSAALAASGLDYAALGHIHRRGERRDGGTLCAWPGCLMGRGFDECGEKGALLVSAEKGACRTAVLLNAGAGLYIGGSALTLEAGVKRAAQLIDSGLAMEKLEDFIMMSQNMGKVEKVKITSCQDDEDYDIIKGTLI